MLNPTLCIPLKAGTKIAALIDTLFSIFATVISIGLVILFEIHREHFLNETLQNPPEYLLEYINFRKLESISIRVFLVFNTIYWFQKIGLGILLYVGTVKESQKLLRLWLIYTVSLLVLSVLFFLASICLQVVEWRTIPIYVAAFVIREYSFWIVNSFVKELRGSGLKSKPLQQDDSLYDVDMTIMKVSKL